MPKREVQQKQIAKREKMEKECRVQYVRQLQQEGRNAIKLQDRSPDVFVAAFNAQLSSESARPIICSRCAHHAHALQLQIGQQHEAIVKRSNMMDAVPTSQRSQFQKNFMTAAYNNNFLRLKRLLGVAAPALNKMRRKTLENFWEWAKSRCSLLIKNIEQQALVDAFQKGMRLLTGDELKLVAAQVIERLAQISDPDAATALEAVKSLGIPEPWQKDAVDLLRLLASDQKSNWSMKESCNLFNELYILRQDQLTKEHDCKNYESRQQTLNKNYRKIKASNTAIANMLIIDWALMPEVSAKAPQAALDYARNEVEPLDWELLLFILDNIILRAEVSNEIRKRLIYFIEKLQRTPTSLLWNATLRNAQNRCVTSLTLSLLAGPWGPWQGVYLQARAILESGPRNLFGDSILYDELRHVKQQLEKRLLLCGVPPELPRAALRIKGETISFLKPLRSLGALLVGSRVMRKQAVSSKRTSEDAPLLNVAAMQDKDEFRRRSGPKRSVWPKLWKARNVQEKQPLLAVVERDEPQSCTYKSLATRRSIS